MKITTVKGMHDITPPETAIWCRLEGIARHLFERYGFAEMRTPIAERTPLFVRGVGASTELVQKEMYTFVDQGGEELTLRPEGTAPVVRSYIEHGLYQADPLAKLYYFGPMFRRERPQKGRFRQFHQIGVELLGTAHPAADAEVIVMAMRLCETLGLRDLRLEVNSLGCADCRPKYQQSLETFLGQVVGQLCEDCQRRVRTNPMRIFDCKNPQCQQALMEAPTVQDFWCDACGEHFRQVCEGLEAVQVTYWCNHRIARGLDYYMRTAFEIVSHSLGGAQNALCGGGRYDGLVRDLGGPDVPGVGFAIGIERLLLLMEQPLAVARLPRAIFVAALGPEARRLSMPLMAMLRDRDWIVEWDYEDRSLKSQLKRADRSGSRYVVIVGDDELSAAKAVVRDMETKQQADVALDQLVHYFADLGGVAA
ncbi:MAG: histidine--tRNA ligase [Deltaproteobacteria bacterium]|nr:histidine--tRNA ligase [Deltaproteobacteria bacterium]